MNFECFRIFLFSDRISNLVGRAGCIILVELGQTDFTDDCRQIKYVTGFGNLKKICFYSPLNRKKSPELVWLSLREMIFFVQSKTAIVEIPWVLKTCFGHTVSSPEGTMAKERC